MSFPRAALHNSSNRNIFIHPKLTYSEYFDVLMNFLYNGATESMNYVPEIHDPLFAQLNDTHFDMVKILDLHHKYVEHFFRNDPSGAEKAMKEYLEFITHGDTISRRGIGELWEKYKTGMVFPFLEAYLKVGAKLESLYDIVEHIGESNENINENTAKRLKHLKNDLVVMIYPYSSNSNSNNNYSNNNQNGGRRRKTRKSHRKNRRATRRHRNVRRGDRR
jgi:hypothetical protein